MKKQPYTPNTTYQQIKNLEAFEKNLYNELMNDTSLSFYSVERKQKQLKQVRADIHHLKSQFQEQ